MKRLLTLASIACCSLAAQATSGTAVYLSKFTLNPQPSSAGWVLGTGSTFAAPASRGMVNGVSAGAQRVAAIDAMSIAGRAGPLPLTVTTSVGLGDAAGAVARCLMGGGVICGAATAAGLLYTGYRIYKDGSGLKFDPGTPETPQLSWYTTATTLTKAPTQGAACDRQADFYRPALPTGYSVYAAPSPSGGCYTMARAPNDPAYGPPAAYIYAGSFPYYSSNSLLCPASIDFSNPANNIPAGSPVGFDGKCPTARYNHSPVTPDQAEGTVVAYPPPTNHPQLLQAVKDALQNGERIGPATVGIQGPASQTGTPTTTTQTNPDGSIQTTTTTTNYTYNYAGDTITYAPVTTTTINNAGAITTIVSTPPAPAPLDPLDPCTTNPTRAGCQQLGDPAPSVELPRQEVPLAAVAVPFAVSAGCPVPFTFAVYGQTYAISTQPLCDLMSTMRPIFLALGAAAAAFIFMQGFKV